MGATRRQIVLGRRERGDQPLMITEFGGLSYAPDEGEKWFGYAAVADQSDCRAGLAGMVGALLGSTEVAGFCYTQLADTEQESNGLLTADRRPKLDPAALRRVIAAPARSLPAERVDLERAMAESQGRLDAAIVDVSERRDGVVDTARN